jgi:4-amino-4-deoxy-L-arabinose transferase-like glycosyltransferase
MQATAANDRPRSLANTRRVLSFGGIGLIVVNLLMQMTGTGSAGQSLMSAVLWGGATVCFLVAFIVYQMEAAARRMLSAPAAHATGTSTKDAKPDGATSTASADAAADADAANDAAADAKGKEKDSTPLLHKGSPLRLMRGGITAAVGGIVSFLLMAHRGQMRIGVPLGILFIAIATWGLMDLLGTFDDPDQRVEGRTTLSALAGPIAALVASLVFFAASIGIAATGAFLPQFAWGIIVTLAFLATVITLYDLGVKLGPWAKDETGAARPLLKRHGFWVVVAAGALYFPFMGSFSLWDPWETHYGEVAREILARDDWISLWWAQDGWFWSKPILDFWMQAIAMAVLGVHYQSDQMLAASGGVSRLHPEWVVRAPVVLLTILAMYLLYKGVSKAFGRRAALLGALVLATMPDWFFLAHQTMTDMPFVASMTAAMGLVLMGLAAPEETNVRVYELDLGVARVRLSTWHLVFGAIIACAVPQILYLFSRNIEFLWGSGGHGFRPHFDEFKSGSAGNCGLPGNEACTPTVPASIPHSVGANPEGAWNNIVRTFGAFEPFVQAIVWAGVLVGLLYMNWGERRQRRLLYLAAWFFCALATMGKGPAGFGLPILCTFAYVATKRRWAELVRFEIVGGLLVILCVALPWYVAMYVRHGSPFTDRLIFHDMFNRAFHHVHDTNEGDDTSFRFYIWQLGYALFPWTALAPLGLTYWLRRADSSDENRGDTSVLLALWFVFAFALFSFMGTKFHHYIFPAIPPIAMLVGVVLDDMIGERRITQPGSFVAYLAGMGGGAALMVIGLSRLFPGSMIGTKGDKLADPAYGMGAALAIAGAALVGLFVFFFRSKEPDASPANASSDAGERRRAHESVMIAGAAIAGALLLGLVGRDLVLKPENADQPGAIRLLHLFTYNYRRPWPESLDFSAALTGFTIVGVAAAIALGVRAVRKHAVVAFLAFAFVWAVWGLDVYRSRPRRTGASTR